MQTRTMMTTLLACSAMLGAAGCRDDKPAEQTPVVVTNAKVENPVAPADPLATAANKDRVRQYPDQEKLAPTPAKLVTGYTTALRESPRGGQLDQVTTVMNVTEVAKDKDYFLVLYADPKDATKTLAGWVYKDSLTAADWPKSNTPPSPAKAKTEPPIDCKSDQVHMRTDRDFCASKCTTDADCSKAGGVCDGFGYQVSTKGDATAGHYCISNDSSRTPK